MPSDLFKELFPVLTTQTDEIIIEYLFISMGSVPSVFSKSISNEREQGELNVSSIY